MTQDPSPEPPEPPDSRGPRDRIAALEAELERLRRQVSESSEELEDTRAEHRSILDTAVDAIVTIDGAGIVDVFNRSAEAMFGYTAEEMRGRNVSALMPPDVAREHDGYIARFLATREARVIGTGREVVGRRKDGSTFPVELYLAPFEDDRFTGFLRDVTEKKRAQREAMQAQKLEAVGRLAGGVAHDFNNLLAGILGGIRIALDGLEPDRAERATLEDVMQEVERGVSLTRRLLDFSRSETPRPKSVCPRGVLSGTEKLMQRFLGEDVELTVARGGTRARIEVDPGQLEQALLNLVINARDAMPHGGRLEVACADENLTAEEVHRLGLVVEPGPYVVLSVTDDGSGMDAETLRQAREAFFTTKAPGVGTGLGLSSVVATVRQSGGDLGLESELGAGTVARLYFPCRAAAEPEAREGGPRSSPRPGRGERILLVEDERLVRLGILHTLEKRLGYRVQAAQDAEEAQRVLAEAQGDFDLLLTDVVLPGQSGPELAADVRGRCPKLAVLYMSAFPHEELVAQGRIPAGAATIEKPFDERSLAGKLRELLDGEAGPGAAR